MILQLLALLFQHLPSTLPAGFATKIPVLMCLGQWAAANLLSCRRTHVSGDPPEKVPSVNFQVMDILTLQTLRIPSLQHPYIFLCSAPEQFHRVVEPRTQLTSLSSAQGNRAEDPEKPWQLRERRRRRRTKIRIKARK